MGIRNALNIFRRNEPARQTRQGRQAIVSPWQTGQLESVVWNDIFGGEAQHATRAEAMSIPGVVKARSIILSLFAERPLIDLDENGPAADQPDWLYRTTGEVSPQMRTALTLDDQMFYGWSLWLTDRDSTGQITEAEHCPIERWHTDHYGTVILDDTEELDPSAYLLLPGPFDGLLTLHTRSLRGITRIENAWVRAAENPVPVVELHQTVENGTDEDEIADFVKGWESARRSTTGATGFTPYDLELKTHGQVVPDLFETGRNASRIDLANLFALPAALLDGSVSSASLTYSTQEGRRNELADYTAPYWSFGLTGRLSQDDVVPAGHRVRFDLSDLYTVTPSPTGPNAKD